MGWPPTPQIGWEIFEFASENAERNSMKLDRKQELNVIYQVCAFIYEVWFFFFFAGKSENQDSRLGLWMAETVYWTKHDRKQDLNVLYEVCVFWADRKTKVAARSLIDWYIFELFSESAERNSTKLDRKQDFNVLYHVCVFLANRKTRKTTSDSDCFGYFFNFPVKMLNVIKWTWQEARAQGPLRGLWGFFSRADQKTEMTALASVWLRQFWLLLWMEIDETLQEARSQWPQPIGKPRWPSRLLIGWRFSTFSS